jgi:dihydroorotase
MERPMKFHTIRILALAICVSSVHLFAQDYDLILKGGHVIDAKNNIDRVMDIAIKDGLIARIAPDIPAVSAVKSVTVTGLYVTPGLIDIHTHSYADQPGMLDHGVEPDDFTFRNGITTVVDAGSSGWRTFPEFKEHIIDHSKTRVLAMLNIVGAGMIGGAAEQNLSDMQAEPTAAMALKYPGVVVGIKSAHFNGPEWLPYEQAVKAGTVAHVPVMIDYGSRRIERPMYELLERVLRPGDIYTHMYSGLRGEQDSQTGGIGKGMKEGRARGVIFDVGNGSGSFSWTVVVPLVKAGFLPDSISTDLHTHSMNSDMKNILNVGDKFLALGVPLKDVVADMTWHPAREILQPQLGNLSVGSPADVAVLNVLHGTYGLQDMYNTVFIGHDRMVCELTVRAGKVVYDLDGLTGDLWDAAPSAGNRQSRRWSTLGERGFGTGRRTPPAGATPAPQRPQVWLPYPQPQP